MTSNRESRHPVSGSGGGRGGGELRTEHVRELPQLRGQFCIANPFMSDMLAEQGNLALEPLAFPLNRESAPL
jgi:hypothetical protein